MDDFDPLAQVHLDLAEGKTRSHFDDVLLLKGTAKDAFTKVAEKYFYKKTSATKSGSGKSSQRSGSAPTPSTRRVCVCAMCVVRTSQKFVLLDSVGRIVAFTRCCGGRLPVPTTTGQQH